MVSGIVFFSWRVRHHLESPSSLQTRRDFLERVGTQAPGMFILGSFSRVGKYVFLFGQDLAIMGCRQDVFRPSYNLAALCENSVTSICLRP